MLHQGRKNNLTRHLYAGHWGCPPAKMRKKPVVLVMKQSRVKPAHETDRHKQSLRIKPEEGWLMTPALMRKINRKANLRFSLCFRPGWDSEDILRTH